MCRRVFRPFRKQAFHRLGDRAATRPMPIRQRKARNAKMARREAREACVLAEAGDGYGQAFSLLGPGVPLARMQRTSSVVKCAGGRPASFYPNGRIESCTLDNNGEVEARLTDVSGGIAACAPRSQVRFDPEGLLLSCGPP